MTNISYSEQIDKSNILKLRELTLSLPPYCRDFFRGIEQNTASRTRIAYAYDLKVFFQFLISSLPKIATSYQKIEEIPLEALDLLSTSDFEEYMDYLKYREEEDQEVFNKEKGIRRKISCLKSFFKYFYRSERLQNNAVSKIALPKIYEKDIIRLDIDEVAMMIDEAENGDLLSQKQKDYHGKTKKRDVALLSLMLGTGIRVSECVGLNIKDLDFNNNAMRIHRKGGKEVSLYFGDEVEEALLAYLEERNHILPENGHEDALFLSLQKKRLGVRSVENLVKKYAKLISPLKKITPHKLRSTYGTNLYRETGDIYLVADVLGHSDVNTTKKHYAALEDERRKEARNKVRLREDR
ncbi:MAG: tyrosine-type recombinase/integrase [Johnsonella sp.]|nr:tyrosine-type recombinase/integrase [Johnsonella sp.]